MDNIKNPANITAEQLAARWFLNQKTLTNWRTQKKGPAYIKLGGRILYPLEVIEQYERNNTVQACLGDAG